MLNRVRGFLRRLGRNEPICTDATGLPFLPAQLRSLVAGADDLEWLIEGGWLGAASIRDVLQRNNLALEEFDTILGFGKPGGFLLITTHGEVYLDQIANTERRQFMAGGLAIRKSMRSLCLRSLFSLER